MAREKPSNPDASKKELSLPESLAPKGGERGELVRR